MKNKKPTISKAALDKLTFNGFDVEIWMGKGGINIMDSNGMVLYKDEIEFLLPTLIPERRAEMERILKAMEEK